MILNRLFKGSSKGDQKITPNETRQIVAQFEKLSSRILKVPEVMAMITFDEAISYFQSDRPPNLAFYKNVIIRQDCREGHLVVQAFLDKNNEFICRSDRSLYGRQLVVKKLDKKLRENFDANNDTIIFEGQKTEDSAVRKAEVIKLSDDVQLTVKGLPSDLPRDKRKAVLESLIRNTLSRLPQRGYDRGENIYQGQAKLKLNEKAYNVFFSLDAIRVITALQIYKGAFDAINAGAKEGVYDPELAEIAANHIKQYAWDEVQSVMHLERTDKSDNLKLQKRLFKRS